MQLPHRPPFLFVDEIVAAQPEVSAHGRKTFHSCDPVFGGHFPGNPLVPGVLLTEALAQTSGLIMKPGASDRQFLLAAIRRMKFPSAVLPDECIDLFSSLAGVMGLLFRFDVLAQVDGRIVAEGEVILCLQNNHE